MPAQTRNYEHVSSSQVARGPLDPRSCARAAQCGGAAALAYVERLQRASAGANGVKARKARA